MTACCGNARSPPWTSLKEALGTSADATVFRKLAELDYRTSYSHRGRFYTLDEIAASTSWGCGRSARCGSRRFGTLVSTVEALVGAADAGYDAAELEAVLHVEAKQALLALVRAGRLAREEWLAATCTSRPSADSPSAQLAARLVYDAEASRVSASARGLRVLPDELKAAIVLFYSLLDERQRRLYAGLEAMKIGHGGDAQVAELLGIDPGTVARGRRELLAGDVEPGRVRRAGGGQAVGKKNPRGHRADPPADGARHRRRPDQRHQMDPTHHREDRRRAAHGLASTSAPTPSPSS